MKWSGRSIFLSFFFVLIFLLVLFVVVVFCFFLYVSGNLFRFL